MKLVLAIAATLLTAYLLSNEMREDCHYQVSKWGVYEHCKSR